MALEALGLMSRLVDVSLIVVVVLVTPDILSEVEELGLETEEGITASSRSFFILWSICYHFMKLAGRDGFISASAISQPSDGPVLFILLGTCHNFTIKGSSVTNMGGFTISCSEVEDVDRSTNLLFCESSR
jgi:hypothetical protein